MRKKLISNTYLRDVDKYNLKIVYDDDCYYAIKEIKKVREPFILSTGECLIDDDYYIVEIIPKNENYSVREFFDNNKRLLQYYIDVSLDNGIDDKTKIPYYDDLFIDITIMNDKIEVLDEDELENALKTNKITMEEYNLAHEVKEKLLDEIDKKNNKYINRDLTNLL